ncbi:hypothetical protein [Streptococcus danieliae]|uniref:hypothetical protein n=1 Tax=Streptococcus danieliae TaxID=747656 RepID=UPI0021C6D2DD|nr:hypothetical protein [Streptococcus danieliae]MCU0082223.1 hypothetical protein [Streptococcus danieliae]
MKFEFILSNTKKQKEMLNSNDRPHWTQKAKITARLRHLGAIEGRKGKTTTYTKQRPCGLVVTVFSPTKRRMDPPNFYPTVKALVDGLTDAGVWTDDNHEVIKYMTFQYGGLSGIKGKYRLEMEIEEIGKT